MPRPAGETRDKLLDAAERLFAQKGYGVTTLDDIAGEVGIKAPGIFRHFRNKQALYEAVVDRLMGGYVEANALLSGQFDPLDTLDSVFEYNMQHPNLARILQHASLADDDCLDYVVKKWVRPFMDQLSEYIDAEELLVKGDFSTKTIFMMFNVMMWGYINLANINGPAFKVKTMGGKQQDEARALLRHIASGLLK